MPSMIRNRTVRALSLAVLGTLAVQACSPSGTEPPPETLAQPGAVRSQPLSLQPGGSGSAVGLSLSGNTGRPVGPAEIQLGTGQFVNPSGLVAGGRGAVIPSGGDVSLEFTNVDVNDVLKTVLGDLLKQSYTVDPAVRGTVTLHTGTPIPRSAVINVLTDTLQLSGVSLVMRNGIYLAVPIANGGRQASIGGTTGFVTRVATAQYVSAPELEKALEPVLPPGVTMKSDASRNLLIVSGSAVDVNRVLENVSAFDVDFMRGMSFAMLPLRYGRAREIVQDVNNMLSSSGRTMTDIVKVFPIDRMNAVLVTSMQPSYIQRVRGWVERFDRGDGHTDPKMFVYRVQNGRATDLAKVLRRALGIDQSDAGPGANTDDGPTLGSQPALPLSNASSGYGGSGARPPPGSASTQQPPDQRGRNDPLSAVSTLAGGVTPAGGPAGQNPLPDLKITADPTNNALVIVASSQDYRQIEAALQKLDIAPLQVLIEATVAEVTLNDKFAMGLQYAFKTGNFASIFAPKVAASTASSTAQGPGGGVVPGFGFPGFGFLSAGNLVYSSGDTTLLLQALSELTTVRVLSSPNLMVLNNGVARLQVGDQVPIATQSARSNIAPDAPTVNSIDYRDTGIILNVVPRVNASGLVLLDISEEVSTPQNTQTSSISSPTISQRRVTSSVAVQDGQTIALAGLIQDQTERGNAGIPWLKDIPVLGFVFGYRAETTKRTELLVTITPRVVRSREDGDAVTRELREKLRATIPVVARRR